MHSINTHKETLFPHTSEKLLKRITLTLITTLALIFNPLHANAAGTVIDRDHTDAFYIDLSGEKPKAYVRNGIHNNLYKPESTEIHISARDYRLSESCENQFSFFDAGKYVQLSPKGDDGYYPVCSSGASEPGMSAPDAAKYGYSKVQLQFLKVDAPGALALFLNNQYMESDEDAILPLLESGKFFLSPGDTITVPGHAHFHWFFEHAGTYRITAKAIATRNSGEILTSEPFEVTFRVLKSESDQRRTPANSVTELPGWENSAETDPSTPHPPVTPETGELPENSNTETPDPALPNPELPDPSRPDPELPDPEVPETELPDPELPDPELPDAELPNPTLPEPALPNPELPDPKHDHTSSARIILSKGHIDLFNVISKNGKLILNAKDDTTGQPILRKPEDLIIHVGSHALTNFPPAYAKRFGTQGYFLGQNGETQGELPFPGWDTSAVRPDFNAIDLQFLEVKGPGKIYTYQISGFGGPTSPLASGNFELTGGDKIHQENPAHVHTNWIFTKPGIYTMKVRAADARTGNNDSIPEIADKLYTPGTGVSNTAVYTWYVGEKVPAELRDGKTVPEKTPETTETEKEDRNREQPNQDLPSDSANESQVIPSSETETKPANPANSGADHTANIPAVNKQKYEDAIFVKIKDDRSQPAKWADPASLVFAIGASGQAKTVENVGRIPAGSDVWMISSSQVQGVPWLGVNSQHPTLLTKTTGYLKLTLSSFSGPGAMEVFYSNNFGGAGQRIFSGINGAPNGAIVLNPNVHAHPNWVFSKPGTYRVGITASAVLKSGKTVSNSALLTFNIGSNEGITNGHFDLGAAIGQALAGTAGTSTDSGTSAVPASQNSFGNHSQPDLNGDLLSGEELQDYSDNPKVKALNAAKLKQGKHFAGSDSANADTFPLWNTNTLLTVIIILLLLNASLMGLRLIQSRKTHN